MTWVVGKAFPFGYAVGLSDVRVTVEHANGRTTECDSLQKVYKIAPNIAVGFAGSVKIGFTIVALLRRYLRLPPDAVGYDPVALTVTEFPKMAQECFKGFDAREQAGQSQLLFLSINPNEKNGDLPVPRSYVHKLCSPTFEAEPAPPMAAQSIGSGAHTRTSMHLRK